MVLACGLPKRQSSVVCVCLINWASSLGCSRKPRTDASRTDDTKMGATNSCWVMFLETVSLEFIFPLMSDFFFPMFFGLVLSRPVLPCPRKPFLVVPEKRHRQLMKIRHLSTWWLSKGPASPQGLISSESRVTVIWESDGGQLSMRKSQKKKGTLLEN